MRTHIIKDRRKQTAREGTDRKDGIYMMYKASVKLDGHIMTITSEYNSKKDFAADLRKNGYKVSFVSTPENFDADLEKYCEKKERINRVKKYVREARQDQKTKRFFYMSDIDSTMCVEISTKKDMLDLIDETIRNNYTCEESIFDILYKDGTEIRIDENNRKYKKTGIISIVNDNGTTVEVYGNFEINDNGVVYPAAETIIDDHLFEVTSWDYKAPTEDEINDYISYEIENDVEEQEPEENEQYIAWCGMIENDVITEEHETLSEAIDEVETRYTKEEQKEIGVSYCRLLCNNKQWLECLEEKTVDDVYYF